MAVVNAHNLACIGKALWGDYWRAPFAHQFDINPRTLRKMIAGTAEVPAGLVQEMETALRDRSQSIDRLLEIFV